MRARTIGFRNRSKRVLGAQVPKDLAVWFDKEAERRGVSLSTVVREALETYWEQQENHRKRG